MEASNSSKTPSHEHYALIDFCYRLGSSDFATDANNAEEETSTRQEAKLLMSLLESNHETSDPALILTSDSDNSYSSESTKSRGSFVFSCPSLSLEAASSTSDNLKITTPATEILPSSLLGRPLCVDDRDAFRLSADAMARNLLHSYQKAIEWRTDTWAEKLSGALVQQEGAMLASGASEGDLRAILDTCEAQLLLALRNTSIKVIGAWTSFRVTEKIEEPATKKRRLSTDEEYSVTHSLVLECNVNLETGTGHSEVNLQVPGTIKGSFFVNEYDMEELSSVMMEIDTNILSFMIEKSTRKVVRAAIEELLSSTEPANLTEQPVTKATDVATTPLRPAFRPSEDEAPWANIVTPRNLTVENSGAMSMPEPSPKPVILSIPDNLDEPRRISPQTTSIEPSFKFLPRTPAPKGMILPLVSPPANESKEFHEVTAQSPSLPMLAEAAFRAMQTN